ncbi:MAG: hypothetical protein QOE10_1401, partial [Gaiellales bacterium]|nr:hypothetical protein [Gaiellales bacterium]
MGRGSEHGLDDLGRLLDLERVTHEQRAALDDELGIVGAAAGEQGADLALDGIAGLTRQRAPLEAQHAALGIGRELATALDQRGVHRAGAERGVRSLAQALLELCEPHQDRAHLDDRVDAETGPRAVGGDARDLDLDPAEALVRDRDLELGRLGHD